MRLKSIVLLAAIVGSFAWYSKKQEISDPARAHAVQSEPLLVERAPTFQCEGKTRCSHMSEAGVYKDRRGSVPIPSFNHENQGSSVVPIKYRSHSLAAPRPSLIAHTIKL
jgi:hypothetical protein